MPYAVIYQGRFVGYVYLYQGYHLGYHQGYHLGYHLGNQQGYHLGYHLGYQQGYHLGYQQGYHTNNVNKDDNDAFLKIDAPVPISRASATPPSSDEDKDAFPSDAPIPISRASATPTSSYEGGDEDEDEDERDQGVDWDDPRLYEHTSYGYISDDGYCGPTEWFPDEY